MCIFHMFTKALLHNTPPLPCSQTFWTQAFAWPISGLGSNTCCFKLMLCKHVLVLLNVKQQVVHAHTQFVQWDGKGLLTLTLLYYRSELPHPSSTYDSYKVWNTLDRTQILLPLIIGTEHKWSVGTEEQPNPELPGCLCEQQYPSSYCCIRKKPGSFRRLQDGWWVSLPLCQLFR